MRPTSPSHTAALRMTVAGFAVMLAACSSRPPVPPPAPPTSARPAPAGGTPARQWQNEWARGTVFYEIFVRSFADSDGDGIGDLRGLTARLPYLNDGDPTTDTDLGIGGIWLMPVFSSPSYHGYDVVDYEQINPDYGTLEDFRVFLREAHRRGIRLIVDFVINHSGRDHPWFVESASSPTSPKRDWYVWRADDPGWKQPWGDQKWPTWHEANGAYYYGIFWAGMPDLNLANPEVRAEVKRIASLWLGRGVDGFRLDAARHALADGPGQLQNDTPASHAFWREFAAFVRETAPDALLVGENWTSTEIIATYYGDASKVALGDELQMNFNFPLAGAIVASVRERDAGRVLATLEAMRTAYPDGVLDGTFLTNHDMVRIATELGSDPARLASAAAVLLTLPGTPFLYYGEELGMVNGPTAEGDPAKRTPMPWNSQPAAGFTSGVPWRALAPGWEQANVAALSADPDSLLSLYRRLIHLRSGSPALRRGVLEPLAAPASVLAFVRVDAAERLLVVHNLGAAEAIAGPYPLAATELALLFAADGSPRATRDAGGWTVALPAGASAVFAAR
jgi:glycosidase